MASQTLSRAAALTLADVLGALEHAELPERRRQELASAVRTAARALGRTPEAVAADPRLLAARLAAVAPAAVGLSPGRWANVRSLLRKALALVAATSPGRHLTPLSPEWQALRDSLERRSLQAQLSRLMHFCSAAGIAPGAITPESFAQFRVHLDGTLLQDPALTYRDTLAAWNRARTEVAGWPDMVVEVPSRRRDWTLPWSAFPASLEADARMWLDRLGGQDLLTDLPFRPVRPSTLKQREWQIRAFASALVRQGWDPAALVSLHDLVAVDAVKAGLRVFLQANGNRATSHTGNLAGALKAIARHHVGVGEDHLDRLRAVARKVDPGRRRGLNEANRSRLRALDDRGNLLALLRLPERLMSLVGRERRPYRAALLAQMAVAIEILLMAPLRIGNLVRLDLERHLVRTGRAGGLHIVIEGDEVKNREPLEYPLPAASAALIDRYLKEYRPILAQGGTALFPGDGGRPKGRAILGEQIGRVVRNHAGLRVHPHLFRHIAAQAYLNANPGAYEVVRRVLGHRSMDTTTRFYTGLETAAAVRHFDATILRLRREEPK